MRPSTPPAPRRPGRPARALLGAAAAIVVAAIGAILWISGRDAGAPRPGVPALGAAADDAAARDIRPPSAPAVTAAAQARPPPEDPAAPKAWSDVPLAVRLSDLGPPLARPVWDGLQKARAAMEPCFEADARDAAAHPRAPNQEDGWGAAILTLQMEGRPGELVVLNAPLQSIGTSSMMLVECCEGVLRGFRIPAPAAAPGRRYRLQHQLTR